MEQDKRRRAGWAAGYPENKTGFTATPADPMSARKQKKKGKQTNKKKKVVIKQGP
jgi:hypothetical protein